MGNHEPPEPEIQIYPQLVQLLWGCCQLSILLCWLPGVIQHFATFRKWKEKNTYNTGLKDKLHCDIWEYLDWNFPYAFIWHATANFTFKVKKVSTLWIDCIATVTGAHGFCSIFLFLKHSISICNTICGCKQTKMSQIHELTFVILLLWTLWTFLTWWKWSL